MTAVFPQNRLTLVLFASITGITVSWLAATPFGLLAPVAALGFYARGRIVQFVYAIVGIALLASGLVALFNIGDFGDLALSWAAFFAVALCIAALFITNSSGSSDDEPVHAAQTIERVVGNAWATDAAGRFLYVTPAALAFLGITLDDLNRAPDEGAFGWKRVIHPEDYDAAAAAWRRCLQTGDHYNVEHRMLRANCIYGWGRSTGQPLRNKQGFVKGWYGTVIDSDAPSGVNGHTTSVSDAASEQQSSSDVDAVHPHDRASVAQASARAFFHGVPQVTSYRQLQTDGSYRWIELRVEPEYSTSVDAGVAVAMQDHPWTMSQSVGETGEAVRAAQFLENLYGGAWALDARGKFTYATPTAQTSIGMTLEDLNQSLDGRDFIDGGEHGWKRTVHPADYDRMAAGFRHGLRTAGAARERTDVPAAG